MKQERVMGWKERYTMTHKLFWKNRNMEKAQEIMREGMENGDPRLF